MSKGMFEQVLLRETTLAGVLHLSWAAKEQGERLVQVYVNGEFYDVSMEMSQREMWIHAGGERDVGVELVMVEAGERWVERMGEGREVVAMLRDEGWPTDARAVVKVDGEDVAEARVWDVMDDRSGFGGLFGEGGFGRDDASAAGSGMGEFGIGGMGMDGRAWRWGRRERLEKGTHAVSVRVTDGAGRTIAEMGEARMVEVEGFAKPASELVIDGDFVLHIQP